MKADKKVSYDGEIKENFTYFEELVGRVKVLQDEVEEIQRILLQNDLHYVKKIYANTNIEDKTITQLMGEYEDENNESS